MAELARKDGRSLGISTKKLKARLECRASMLQRGRAWANPRPSWLGDWSLQVPVGMRKVANEAHLEPDLQSHTVRE